jgi:hypothetical protein
LQQREFAEVEGYCCYQAVEVKIGQKDGISALLPPPGLTPQLLL